MRARHVRMCGADALSPTHSQYIQFAKNRPRKPQLTPAASDYIAGEYADWRRRAFEDRNATLPVTARTLETMIRLATAHAKMRLGNDVSREDAEAALDVMRFALGAEEVSTRRAEKEEETKKADAKDAKEARDAAKLKATRAAAANGATPAVDAPAAADEDDAEMEEEEAPPETAPVDGSLTEVFHRALVDLLVHRDECTVEQVCERLRALGRSTARETVVELLEGMSADNRIMFQDPMVYKI